MELSMRHPFRYLLQLLVLFIQIDLRILLIIKTTRNIYFLVQVTSLRSFKFTKLKQALGSTSIKCFKEVTYSITKPLALIINHSTLKTGIFPEKLKIAIAML